MAKALIIPLLPQLYELVTYFESLHDGDKRTPELEPMMCPAGVWTVGYGLVLCDQQSGRQLKGDADRAAALAEYRRRWPDGMTSAVAERELANSLERHAATVRSIVTVPLEPHQLSALVSFNYNTGALRGSTLLKLLNAGDLEGAAAQFDRWTKATVAGRKVTLAGLVTRRNAEEAMFRGGDWRSALSPQPIARAVEPPAPAMKPLTESRTIKAAQIGGTLAGVGTLIETVGPQLDQVQMIGDKVRALATFVPAGAGPWFVAAVLAASLAYMVWRRIDDHRQQSAA